MMTLLVGRKSAVMEPPLDMRTKEMVSFVLVAGISSAIPGIPMHILRKGIVLKLDRNMS